MIYDNLINRFSNSKIYPRLNSSNGLAPISTALAPQVYDSLTFLSTSSIISVSLTWNYLCRIQPMNILVYFLKWNVFAGCSVKYDSYFKLFHNLLYSTSWMSAKIVYVDLGQLCCLESKKTKIMPPQRISWVVGSSWEEWFLCTLPWNGLPHTPTPSYG